MRKMATSKGNWKISGINIIPSDSIYINIQKAIEEGNLTQEYIQSVTGHLAPIYINKDSRTITFASF